METQTRYERLVVQEQRTETSRLTQTIESLRSELDQTKRHADLSSSQVCTVHCLHLERDSIELQLVGVRVLLLLARDSAHTCSLLVIEPQVLHSTVSFW